MHGELIVLEGPDGAGKTTLAGQLARTLAARGRTVQNLALPGNIPGTLGHLVHRLHHDRAELGIREPIDEAALQMLHAGSHIDTIQKLIRPTIAAGESVILDRFWWSTQVYGRVAGVDDGTLASLRALAEHHWAALMPRVLFLILDPPTTVALAPFRELRFAYEELAAEGWPFPVIRVPGECITSEARLDFLLRNLQ